MKKQIILLIAITGFCYQSSKAQATVEQPRPPKPPSIEERMKHVDEKLAKEISLTADQKKKVEAAYKDFFVTIKISYACFFSLLEVKFSFILSLFRMILWYNQSMLTLLK